MLRFTVEGRPVPAVRQTRTSRYGTDDKRRRAIARYDAYKDLVGWAAREAGAHPETQLDGELYLHATVYVQRRGTFDGDNVLKSLADGLQGVAFTNDRQITDWRLRIVAGAPEDYVRVELGTAAEMTASEWDAAE